MKRVVVTGYGIVSCLGNDRNAVLDSLKQGRSGIKFQQSYVDMGMRSHVAGSIDVDIHGQLGSLCIYFHATGY
jgi:3-oxoacyl-[acyl-carrier-protein] synthase-1